MSHIIKNSDTLVFLKEMEKDILNHGINLDIYLAIIKELLPKNEKNELLVSYRINTKGMKPAFFNPNNNCIYLNINAINTWLKDNLNDLTQLYNVKDTKTFSIYLFYLAITHEIEHSYQYLMAYNIIPASVDLISLGYKGLFDFMISKQYIIPRPIKETRSLISRILYNIKANELLLERNAQIESTDLLVKYAQFNNRDDQYRIFQNMNAIYNTIGYYDSNNGSLEETYKKILMFDKYKKFYEDVDMSEEDRVRYGLNICEETRQNILKYRKRRL